jgi:plastocyanin
MNYAWFCARVKSGIDQAARLCVVLLIAHYAQPADLAGRVEFHKAAKGKTLPDASNAVVWLTPLNASEANPAPKDAPQHPRLVQHNKQFEPHVLVVRVGSSVEFPNRDPFFHNVFSLFEGKRFDLGLYEAGTTRDVRFDRPGISYIFCNIHPEMSAVVIAVETPYYAISNSRGDIHIPDVPAGRYLMRVWSEASLPDDLKSQAREITVGQTSSSLGTIRLRETPPVTAHKNKYGQDYEPPSPSSPAYSR